VRPDIDVLFNYLRDVIYEPENAVLNIEKLPEDLRELGSGLQFFSECVIEINRLASALSKGDLVGALPSRDNEMAGPLKSLHASLKHLTWQAQQIAAGDYKQRVDFMGDFSDAFNKMVEQLAEREQNLIEKIEQIQLTKASLEQSNHLLTALMHYVPQQILVLDRSTREVLLMNDIAKKESHNDPKFFDFIIKSMDAHDALDHGCDIEITYTRDKQERYYMVKTYLLEWNEINAEIFAVSDITATKHHIEELETHAYYDSLTQLYNRNFGMLTLDTWLHEKRQFVLVFVDLDSLKYVNDKYGHNEGDIYIINAAKYLKTFSPDTIVCRIGGDEFMMLAPDTDYYKAEATLNSIYDKFINEEYLIDKPFQYSLSFGIVAVGRDNKMSASDVLSVADERMYQNKRMRKKERRTSLPES